MQARFSQKSSTGLVSLIKKHLGLNSNLERRVLLRLNQMQILPSKKFFLTTQKGPLRWNYSLSNITQPVSILWLWVSAVFRSICKNKAFWFVMILTSTDYAVLFPKQHSFTSRQIETWKFGHLLWQVVLQNRFETVKLCKNINKGIHNTTRKLNLP